MEFVSINAILQSHWSAHWTASDDCSLISIMIGPFRSAFQYAYSLDFYFAQIMAMTNYCEVNVG